MSEKRRVCRLADRQYKDIDLRQYEEIIIDTINRVVPGKHPTVSSDSFSTDTLTQSQSVQRGRALSRLDALKQYGKQVTQYRLFEGEVVEPEDAATSKRPRGGRKNNGKNAGQKIPQY